MSLIGRKWDSTDPGAPVLSGTYGSMIAVLRAVLVEGYGAGSDLKASAGWTEEFAGALPNVAVFRNNPVSGMGGYLRVDDSDAALASYSAHSARFAWVKAFKSMSDINTGTDQTPTAASLPFGGYIIKSDAASSAPVAWSVYANERTCYLIIQAPAGKPYLYFFGDFESDAPGDQFAFATTAQRTVASTGPATGTSSTAEHFLSTYIAAKDFQVLRGASGASGPVDLSVLRSSLWSAPAETLVGGDAGVLSFPDAISGGARFVRPYFAEGSGIRGRLYGFWAPLHNLAFANKTVLAAADGMPQLEVRNYGMRAVLREGQCAFEVGVPWL